MTSGFDRRRCERAEDVAAYAVGALPIDDVPALQAHLAFCRDCHDELQSLRPVLESFVAWPTDVLRPSKSLWGRLASRIGAEPEEPSMEDAPRRIEPEWENVAPGIWCKLLATEGEGSRVSMLVRLAPGADYPPHTHAATEELHLLHGELWIDDRKLYPGDYNRAEAGTSDKRVWSETGCTCLLITSSRDALHLSSPPGA